VDLWGDLLDFAMAAMEPQVVSGDHRQRNRQCANLAFSRAVILSSFNIPEFSLDPSFDRCFCSRCTADTDLIHERGNPPMTYKLPVGFARIGLKVSLGFAQAHNIFKEWHACFHGTKLDLIESIFKGDLKFLPAGTVSLGGGRIGVRPGHIKRPFRRINQHTGKEEMFDPNQIFTSPSPLYAGDEVYATTADVPHPTIAGEFVKVR